MPHNIPDWNTSLLVLPNNEVHIWLASLDVPAKTCTRLRSFLSEEEISRANRFYFPQDRDYFVVGRGLLRIFLGQYLDSDPTTLHFTYGRYGKPVLDPNENNSELSFNMSHSKSKVIYAFSHGREVGIDIEDLNRDVDREQIVRRNCSEQEKIAYHTVPTELKQEAFINCWTRKEAYIKARGEGLAAHLDQITVSLVPGDEPRLLDTQAGEHEITRWTLKEIDVGSGYVAAVIAEGHDWHLRQWDWSWVRDCP